ncbi:hypothetical protein QBC41DRAFT_236039 [Cercophora samala]|uniref:Uncharacterized protein n=1 Tax=Cercophora samala TaxID=330535 RepID=A0AA40D3F5_9PEZI|nr:hypothetical protein QBC41DRAFT_236039 [Cercophora samala]
MSIWGKEGKEHELVDRDWPTTTWYRTKSWTGAADPTNAELENEGKVAWNWLNTTYGDKAYTGSSKTLLVATLYHPGLKMIYQCTIPRGTTSGFHPYLRDKSNAAKFPTWWDAASQFKTKPEDGSAPVGRGPQRLDAEDGAWALFEMSLKTPQLRAKYVQNGKFLSGKDNSFIRLLVYGTRPNKAFGIQELCNTYSKKIPCCQKVCAALGGIWIKPHPKSLLDVGGGEEVGDKSGGGNGGGAGGSGSGGSSSKDNGGGSGGKGGGSDKGSSDYGSDDYGDVDWSQVPGMNDASNKTAGAKQGVKSTRPTPGTQRPINPSTGSGKPVPTASKPATKLNTQPGKPLQKPTAPSGTTPTTPSSKTPPKQPLGERSPSTLNAQSPPPATASAASSKTPLKQASKTESKTSSTTTSKLGALKSAVSSSKTSGTVSSTSK